MNSKINKYSYIFLLLIGTATFFTSCSKDDVKVATAQDEVSALQPVDTITKGNYSFYIFKKDTGNFVVGYNEVYIQVKNNVTGKYVEDANLSWKPLMHMTSMSHACPYSTISKVANTNTLYKGYFIFIMASSTSNYWEITYNYTSGNDTLATVTNRPSVVTSTGKVRYKSFKGSDNVSYFLALVEPSKPQVGSNDVKAYLYKKVDILTFTPVENYTIQIDPRMPDMDNHTSPNNVNLTYDSSTQSYQGKVNLTMTGYWKINLIVQDASSTVLKGEAITGSTTASSIYFELEF